MSQSISINASTQIDDINVNMNSVKSSVIKTSNQVNNAKSVETLDFDIDVNYNSSASAPTEELDLNSSTAPVEDKALSSVSDETKIEQTPAEDKSPVSVSDPIREGFKEEKMPRKEVPNESVKHPLGQSGSDRAPGVVPDDIKEKEKNPNPNPPRVEPAPEYEKIGKSKTKEEVDMEIAEKELEGMISQGMTKFVDDDGKQYTVYFFIDKDKNDKTKQTAVGILVLDEEGNVVKVMKSTDQKDIDKYGHGNDLEYKDGEIYIATMERDNPIIGIDFHKLISDSTDSFDDLTPQKHDELMDIIKDDTDYDKVAAKIRAEEVEAAKNDKKIKPRSIEEIKKSLQREKGTLRTASGIAYDDSTNPPTWYVSSGRYVSIIRDGKVVDTIVKPKDLSRIRKEKDNPDYYEHEAQGIYAKDGKLYVIRHNRNSQKSNGGENVAADDPEASKNIVDVYDSNGKYEGSYPVEVKEHGPNDEPGELESISYDEKNHRFVANFYYKDGSDNSTRGMTEGELTFDDD